MQYDQLQDILITGPSGWSWPGSRNVWMILPLTAWPSPESEKGKEICALHRRWFTIPGTQYDPAKLRGIAELYVMDGRFTAYYDKRFPARASFLRDAVVYWAK